jgi:hypothetical protein
MLLDASRFSFTDAMERAYPVFRRELEDLRPEEFIRWPAEDAYTGDWLVFPFVVHCAPPGFSCDVDGNRARCPESARILLGTPRVRGAAFSRLTPGSSIRPHPDLEVPRVVRAHLGLRVPDGAELIVGGHSHGWEEGRLLLFNGQILHSTRNNGTVPRDILIVDFEMTADELALVARGTGE